MLVVLGGCVLDVQAHPTGGDDVRRGGSVPGHVAQVPGGVARNIAQAATCLLRGSASSVLLLSVVGQDPAGDALLAACDRHGMQTQGIHRSAACLTPSVCTVLDRAGEVAASVASVEAVEQVLTPERIEGALAADIGGAALLVLDANLTAAALAAATALAARRGAPVLLEPVSVPKATRCLAALRHVAYITPNAAELIAIGSAARAARGLPRLTVPPAPAGIGAQAQLQALAPFAHAVLAQGCRCIVLTLGEQGAALITRDGARALAATHVPALPAQLLNLSGAGDCLVAGFAAAKLRGEADVAALAVGIAAATVAVETAGNVPSDMSYARLHQRVQALTQRASSWRLPVLAAL